MTRRPQALVVLTFVAASGMSPYVWAQAPPSPLPGELGTLIASIPTTKQLAETLGAERASASRCTVEAGSLRCACVVGDAWLLDAFGPDELSGLRLTHDGASIVVGSAVNVEEQWMLRDVWFVRPDSALHVDEVRVGESTTMRGLQWFEPQGAPPQTCGAAVNVGRASARADSATDTGSQWHLEGYRVGPWPVPAAGRADRSAPGLLPPVVRNVQTEAVEVEASGLIYGGLFGLVAGGVNAPLSFGLGYASLDDSRVRALRAMVAIEEGDVDAVVVGDVAAGGTTHLRGHVEHPATDSSWALRRRELGGFFRDYRATRVGAAASGDGHAMQIIGEVVTSPESLEPAWVGGVQYGMSFRTNELLHWTVDVEQSSDRRVEDTRHSLTAAVGVRAPIGNENKLWFTPGLDLVANYGAVTVARGFDASSTLSGLAHVQTGLALEGRGRRTRHRLAPVVTAGAEVGGAQQRQAREGAPPYPYTRPDRWRWASAVLQQSVDDGLFELELPVGAFADAFGEQSLGDGFSGAGGFARASVRVGPARSDVGIVCLDGCERVGFSVGAQVRMLNALRATYRLSDLSERDARWLYVDRLGDRSFTAVRLVQPVNTVDVGPGHYAQLELQRRHFGVRVDGRYGDDAGARGLGVDASWLWPELGWGIGAGAAWAPPTGAWAASMGLRFGM